MSKVSRAAKRRRLHRFVRQQAATANVEKSQIEGTMHTVKSCATNIAHLR